MMRVINIVKKLQFNNKFPIAAIIVYNNFEIGLGLNYKKFNYYSSSHAEINAIKQASFYFSNRLVKNSTLYINLEPCPICLYYISKFNIKNIIFGSYNIYYKTHKYDTNISLNGGILKKECDEILKYFYKKTNNKLYL